MHIMVLALDGVFDTGLSTVLDAFQTANELAALSGLVAPRFDVKLVGLRRSVRTSQGLTVPVVSAPAARHGRLRGRAGDRVQDAWTARGGPGAARHSRCC